MSVIAKITNFFFNIMELLLQLIPYGYSNSGLPPQHHQVLLPLRLKIHTLVNGVGGGKVMSVYWCRVKRQVQKSPH